MISISSKESSYEDNFIKPEISKKLNDEFNDELGTKDVLRNQYRDKILSIVKNATKVRRHSRIIFLIHEVLFCREPKNSSRLSTSAAWTLTLSTSTNTF